MRITGETKPSEEKSTESELSMSVITVDESKKEEKDSFDFSRAKAEVFDSTKGKRISIDEEGLEEEEVVVKKDVSSKGVKGNKKAVEEKMSVKCDSH